MGSFFTIILGGSLRLGLGDSAALSAVGTMIDASAEDAAAESVVLVDFFDDVEVASRAFAGETDSAADLSVSTTGGRGGGAVAVSVAIWAKNAINSRVGDEWAGWCRYANG